MTDVTVRPVSPDQHDAVMHYFDMVAYADNPNWSKCYCAERLVEDYDSRTREQNRAFRSQLIQSAKANEGAIDPAVGAIMCFVVAPDQRRQGVATALLDAAVEHLRKRGMRTAEAYPWLGEIDPSRWSQSMYVGPLSMYVKAGFAVEEKHEDFAVVRLAL